MVILPSQLIRKSLLSASKKRLALLPQLQPSRLKKKLSRALKERQLITHYNQKVRRQINLDNSNVIEEPIKTLDSLFKKTLTKPHLYYLPLSEEEVNNN
jgi:hypothetical protein